MSWPPCRRMLDRSITDELPLPVESSLWARPDLSDPIKDKRQSSESTSGSERNENQRCAVCQTKVTGCNDTLHLLDGALLHQVHSDCFKCVSCRRCLKQAEPYYFVPKEHAIYCEEDYLVSHTPLCRSCNLTLAAQGTTTKHSLRDRAAFLWIGGQPYHVLCFKCTHCHVALKNRSNQMIEGCHYCSPCASWYIQKQWARTSGSEKERLP